MEFDFLNGHKLSIKRSGRRYPIMLLDPARKPTPICTLGANFWFDWVNKKAFMTKLAEKIGCNPKLLVEPLEKIGAEIELKGKKILEPQRLLEGVKLPEEGGGTLADRLVRLALGTDITLFHDDRNDAFVAVDGGGHTEVHAIRSRAFELWLRNLFFKKEGRGLAKEAITDTVATLEAMGRFREDSKVINLNNRVAWHDGCVFYDLVDMKWHAVKVTPEGWEVMDKPPILFRRWPHQKQQADPERGGNIDDIFDFVNVKDDQDRLLFKCNLIADLVPDIPHPILIIVGPHGSAKTFSMKVSRRLIDPSKTETLSFNYKVDEVTLQLWQNYAAYYDNIASIPGWLSDMLCRSSTGEGFTKRKLYSDETSIIFEFKRCVGLNGITLAPSRADLVDRALLIGLGEIPEEGRKSEAELGQKFEEMRPKIFGAMMDILSKALKIYPEISLDRIPRMADFALWGEAIARAMGYKENQFLEAYRRNRAKQTAIVLELNPVGLAIIEFMKGQESWQGRPGELLKILEDVAQEHDIDTKEELWPKTATWVVRRIQEVRSNLEAEGISVNTGRKNKRSWVVLSVKGRGKNAGEVNPLLKGGKGGASFIEEFIDEGEKKAEGGANQESGSEKGDSGAELGNGETEKKRAHRPPFVSGNASPAEMPLPDPAVEGLREPEKPKETEPTAQDIEKAICSYPSKTLLHEAKLAEELGVSRDRIKVSLDDLANRGNKVIPRGGGMWEVT